MTMTMALTLTLTMALTMTGTGGGRIRIGILPVLLIFTLTMTVTTSAWRQPGVSRLPFVRTPARHHRVGTSHDPSPACWTTTCLRGGGDDDDDDDDDGGAEDAVTASDVIDEQVQLQLQLQLQLLQPHIEEPPVWANPKRALVLMDVFSEYHGIYLSHQAREAYGVATVSVLSEYMKGYFEKTLPHDVDEWRREYLPDYHRSTESEMDAWKAPLKGYELVAISCESDSGLADAERWAERLNVTCDNGYLEARRNKFQMIEAIGEAGMAVVKQRLCDTSEQATSFAEELGIGVGSDDVWVVVKPVRGVASDDVHLCKNMTSVQDAFSSIQGSTIFGSPGETHESILVQEFAVGQEFAIDIVSKDGEHKIAAIWIYDKRPANGAPFVYFATKVYDGDQSPMLHEYAAKVLDALGIRWGLTHTEVIITKGGPRLVEVNCRQHNMNFTPLTMGCFGYNAFDMLLAAYLGGNTAIEYPPDTEHLRLEWDVLPMIPMKRRNGAMVHLSSFVEGTLRSVNEMALREIQQMQSVMDLEIYGYFLQPGNEICKTVDIRTDCGWVQLVNSDPEEFNTDYNRIIELMPSILEVE